MMGYLRRWLGWLRYFVRGPEPLPVLPDGQCWVLYVNKKTPKWGMLVIRDQAGFLWIGTGPNKGQRWEPTNEWTFKKEARAGGNA